MKIPFRNIFSNKRKEIPEAVVAGFDRQFPGAFNIDWDLKKHGYEAIFYIDDVEHIARLSDEGVVLEHKRNLWLKELPGEIAAACIPLGEIMNCIVITKEGTRYFELIVRDSNLIRSLYLFDESARLINSRQL